MHNCTGPPLATLARYGRKAVPQALQWSDTSGGIALGSRMKQESQLLTVETFQEFWSKEEIISYNLLVPGSQTYRSSLDL